VSEDLSYEDLKTMGLVITGLGLSGAQVEMVLNQINGESRELRLLLDAANNTKNGAETAGS
jgi:hypothetical protein